MGEKGNAVSGVVPADAGAAGVWGVASDVGSAAAGGAAAVGGDIAVQVKDHFVEVVVDNAIEEGRDRWQSDPGQPDGWQPDSGQQRPTGALHRTG